MSKDKWDKAEVFGKVAGAILIPIVVAGSAAWFNSQANRRATATEMTKIAVGILSEDPKVKPETNGPLREWAISVLENPGEIVPLSPAAAKQLEFAPLSYSTNIIGWMLSNPDQMGSGAVVVNPLSEYKP